MTNEFFKVFGDFKTPAFDFNSLFELQRRNLEAFAAANQVVAEGAQAIARRQANALRENVDKLLNSSKDLVSKGTPEFSLEKQAALAKDLVESSLSNTREVSEIISKSTFDAFDLLNKRAAESLDEFSDVAVKTAASAKK